MVRSAPDDELLVILIEHAGAARRCRDALRTRLLGESDRTVSDALIVSTELVRNAFRHGVPPVELRVRLAELQVHVGVYDDGTAVPPSSAPVADIDAHTGRGLHIVERVASEWIIERAADRPGKTVWALLDR